MEKYVIEGIQPFNDFFFENCYYHQLLSGLSAFGVNSDNILLNTIPFIEENFGIKDKKFFSESKIEKVIGYKAIRCNINKKRVLRYLAKGNPVIVGVDCYFLESRLDTYHSIHFPHFVLIYGYDLTNATAYIVDHNYRNNNVYTSKIVSLDNLIYANKMYASRMSTHRYTCRRLIKRKKATAFNMWKHMGVEYISNNQSNSLKNIELMKKLIETKQVAEYGNNIVEYLQKTKTMFFTFSKTKPFILNADRQQTITSLIAGYSNLLSLFYKMQVQKNYDYIDRKMDAVIRKINEIIVAEAEIYEYLLEECR